MKKIFFAVTAVLFAIHASSALAATAPKTVSDKAPACNPNKLTPAYTKSLAANVLGTSAIVANTSYYEGPCYRAVVDFLIAPVTPGPQPHPYEDFYFDSMGNELVDTKEKCETYQQSTEVYLVLANGNLSLKDKGMLVGAWSGNKCHFSASGQNDFRSKKYSPATSQSHYRVMSTVTTGKGIVWGPNNQPNTSTAIYAQGRGFATPRGVCFAVEHQHNDNTPVVGCADPTR